MRYALACVLAVLTLVPISGCGPKGLAAVCPGMMPNMVERLMGPPREVIHGDLAGADKKTYVYLEGKVHFRLNQVYMVEPAKHQQQRSITEGVQEQERREKSP